MRNKISFGSFFDISSSEPATLALPFDAEELILLLKVAVVLSVWDVATEPLRVVISWWDWGKF